jgi:hypothetical protein
MELHRAHGVQLVVVYVQSVDSRVFELVKRYVGSEELERDLLMVTIRTSLRMPSGLHTLDYDPNTETIWNNQVINFQDCLHEFKVCIQIQYIY